jgi:hypothetical protein
MSTNRNLTAAASALRLWLAALTDDYDESVAQVSMRAIAELLGAAVETSQDPAFRLLHAKNLAITIEQALWAASAGKPRPALDDLRNVAEHVLSLVERALGSAAAHGLKVVPKAGEVAHA